MAGAKNSEWQIFTSHGLVLISLLNRPGRTIREISQELDLTERAVSSAISDLIEAEYLIKTKVGRRCFYGVNENQILKYPKSLYIQQQESPLLTVKALRAENLATHADHLKDKTSLNA